MKKFSLTLYAFHLHHTLSEVPGDVDADANLLWENLVKLGETSLRFTGLKDLRSKLVCYDNGKYEPKGEQGRETEWLGNVDNLDLGSLPTPEGFTIHANLQPFLINDTYAADFTLSPESVDISIGLPQLQYFQPSELLPGNIQPSLGQTIWIYGEVDPDADCEQIAKTYATALLAGTNFNPVRKNQGEFFGNPIFEYQVNDSNTPNNPAQQCQIFIELNHAQSSTPQFSENSYDWLLNLLCSYHKIRYVYDLARQRYAEARAIYSYLDKKILEFNHLVNNSQTQLSDLKQLLSEIPRQSLDYTRCLQDLATHHTAIITNITNYQICLDKLTAIGNGNSPESWQDFLSKDCQKWSKQVQTDINYLTPGQELFGQLVDTIRGVIETQQTESDRSLERTVQVLGIGFGGGAIVSGVVTAGIDKINLPLVHKYPFYSSLFLSIIATLGFIYLGWLIVKCKER